MDNFLKSPPGDIPKKIHQIWIGPRQPPIVWLDTWRKKYRSEYPGWDYKLWGEAETAEIKMRNQVYPEILIPEPKRLRLQRCRCGIRHARSKPQSSSLKP